MNEILLEYYAGKPKELIACEGYLADIVKDIKRDHASISPTRTRHVHRNSPAAQKLENALAKYFNVESVTIYWQSSTINAMTFTPFAITIPDYTNKYKAGEKSSLKMTIIVDENLVYKAGLNESELLACILHEIGHNFYCCPIMLISEIIHLVVTLPIGIIMALLVKGALKLSAFIADAIKQHIPIVYNIVNLLSDFNNEYGYFMRLPKSIINGSIAIMSTAGTIDIGRLARYGGEKGADSFAARYGYGPELASGMHKLDVPENMLVTKFSDNAGVVGTFMNDLTTLSIDLIGCITLDPHPNSNQRASAMLKKLENDLKSGDYPPALKKDLENEIKRMRAAYESITDPRRGGDPSIRKGWYKFIDNITQGHSDIRELLNFYFDSFRF